MFYFASCQRAVSNLCILLLRLSKVIMLSGLICSNRQLDDASRTVFKENVRLNEALGYHLKEVEELKRTNVVLAEENASLTLHKVPSLWRCVSVTTTLFFSAFLIRHAILTPDEYLAPQLTYPSNKNQLILLESNSTRQNPRQSHMQGFPKQGLSMTALCKNCNARPPSPYF